MEENIKIIEKAGKANVKWAFTSLQIPEEGASGSAEAIRLILKQCREKKLSLIADISPETVHSLSCKSIEDLSNYGIECIRLDFGYSPERMAELSRLFRIVLNASTVTQEELERLKRAGGECSKLFACHNYYPKEYTGLSKEDISKINLRLKKMGLQTMGFVPGDKVLRGPLYEGLPTAEEHRSSKEDVLLHVLEMYDDCSCDFVMCGDVDLSGTAWKHIACLNEGYVPLRASVVGGYEFLKGQVHHDRTDSSRQVIRSVESRQNGLKVPPHNNICRKAGSICISNEGYLRYAGELEITRVDLPPDKRVNVVGQIHKDDIRYLPYVRNGMGFKII